MHDLYGHVDSIDSCPAKFLLDANRKPSLTIDPAFLAWSRQDNMLVSWIKSTLSEPVLTQVIRLRTAYDIWQSLQLQHATRSRARKAQLLLQLQTLKKGTSTVTDLLHRARAISDNLAAIGHPIPEEDLVLCILRSLPREYDALYILVTSASATTSLNDLHGLLLSQEARVESQLQDVQAAVEPPTTALLTTKHSSSSPRTHGRGRGRGRGRSSSHSSTSHSSNNTAPLHPSCQICNKTSHTALDCFHRMDHSYQGRHPPAKLVAMAASSPSNTVWYTNTGATNHITNDLANLSVQHDYQGGDRVSVGNGQSLGESSIGGAE